MSNRNCLLSQKLCHYRNQGCTLNDFLSSKPVVPTLGVHCPPGVICNSSGVLRNQNHNFALYYKRSLRNIEGNKTIATLIWGTQVSQTFLKLRATPRISINAKGYLLLLVWYTLVKKHWLSLPLIMLFYQWLSHVVVGGGLVPRGHHVGDPWGNGSYSRTCLRTTDLSKLNLF